MDCLSGSLPEGCADVEGKDFLWSDAGEGAISIVYSDIHVQPYAISGQKCLVWMKIYPLRLQRQRHETPPMGALKSGRWYEMSLNNTMTHDGDW